MFIDGILEDWFWFFHSLRDTPLLSEENKGVIALSYNAIYDFFFVKETLTLFCKI